MGKVDQPTGNGASVNGHAYIPEEPCQPGEGIPIEEHQAEMQVSEEEHRARMQAKDGEIAALKRRIAELNRQRDQLLLDIIVESMRWSR